MKKIVIISSVIGGIAIIGAVIMMRGKRKKLEAKIKAGSPDVINPSKATITMVAFPLKKGSGVTDAEKNAVKVVQRYVNAKANVYSSLGIGMLTEDGLFGPLTEAALYKLSGVKQVAYSLYVDMQNYLTSAPELLTPNPQAGDSGLPDYLSNSDSIDPSVLKNDIWNLSNN